MVKERLKEIAAAASLVIIVAGVLIMSSVEKAEPQSQVFRSEIPTIVYMDEDQFRARQMKKFVGRVSVSSGIGFNEGIICQLAVDQEQNWEFTCKLAMGGRDIIVGGTGWGEYGDDFDAPTAPVLDPDRYKPKSDL